MRKYQQLVLVVLSAISIIVLLMYKSENSRLKYILHVVNFFGRTDAGVLSRLENSTKDDYFKDSAYPLPVWQRIGNGFFAYSAFWARNELIAGGEATALVVGNASSYINFRCLFKYPDGTRTGRFHFWHMDNNMKAWPFYVMKFQCKIERDFGTPEAVVFAEEPGRWNYSIVLNYVKPKEPRAVLPATICLNMMAYNGSLKFLTNDNLLQFFFHHQTIGIDHFFVYNSDALFPIRKMLRKTSINVNYFPFNFPYYNLHDVSMRFLVEADCAMRNVNRAKYTIVMDINEFFYPNRKVQDPNSVIRSLAHYDSTISHFELPNFAVCMEDKNKVLMDNALYDPEVKPRHKMFIMRPYITIDHMTRKEVALPLSMAFTHRYIECLSSKDGFYDWRNSVRRDFMHYLDSVRTEISFLF